MNTINIYNKGYSPSALKKIVLIDLLSHNFLLNARLANLSAIDGSGFTDAIIANVNVDDDRHSDLKTKGVNTAPSTSNSSSLLMPLTIQNKLDLGGDYGLLSIDSVSYFGLSESGNIKMSAFSDCDLLYFFKRMAQKGLKVQNFRLSFPDALKTLISSCVLQKYTFTEQSNFEVKEYSLRPFIKKDNYNQLIIDINSSMEIKDNEILLLSSNNTFSGFGTNVLTLEVNY